MTRILSLQELMAAFTVVAIGTAVAVRIVRRVAMTKGLLDIPNERSSHRVAVPRLGGAAFVPIVVLALAILWTETALPQLVLGTTLLGALVLYAVSLVDDVRPLPNSVRLGVQLLVSIAVVWMCAGTASSSPALVWIAPLFVVGVLNIFNFMDGIDGIAGVQAVAAGVAWAVIGGYIYSGTVTSLGLCIAAAALGFLTLNWPPARIFMGDAGSTVLGFFFACVPLLAWADEAGTTTDLEYLFFAAALALWPFLTDGTFTILRRICRRENIFEAHRSHLYQRLVVAGRSHQAVTLVYGTLAGVGGALAYWVALTGAVAVVASAGIVALLFYGLWRWTLREEGRAHRRLEPRSTRSTH